jgi:telomere length regulation protein
MAQIQDLLNQLRAQIQDLPTLLSLLTAPLGAINLLTPQFRPYNTNPLGSFNLSKHIPQLQHVILTHVVPVWEQALVSEGANALLEQYFCPDSFSNAQPVAGEVAMLAYSTLMSSSSDGLTDYGIRILERLVVEYPVDRLYAAVYSSSQKDKLVRGVLWEDCVKNICMVPGKVANAFAARGTGDVPPMLENGMYFNNLSIRCEVLIFSLSSSSSDSTSTSLVNFNSLFAFLHRIYPDALTYLLSKLVNVGLFPASPPHARSQPSFFQTTLPTIRQRLATQHPTYASFWSNLFLGIPSILTLQSILTSLFGSLESLELSSLKATDDSPTARARIKSDAALLAGLVGEITPEKEDLWQIATGLITGSGLREWPESHARIFVCWVSGMSRGAQINLKGKQSYSGMVFQRLCRCSSRRTPTSRP